MTVAASHDAYLAERSPEQRAVLQALRETLRAAMPEAEEVISYAMPGFRIGKHVIAGYAGFAKNCGFYPHSGNILPQFREEIVAMGFMFTPGALQFTPSRPLPAGLVVRLVAARRAEAGV
jgi:uncharacterized protein YdhG (YjbR/CyaY superfamily)